MNKNLRNFLLALSAPAAVCICAYFNGFNFDTRGATAGNVSVLSFFTFFAAWVAISIITAEGVNWED